MKIKLGKDETLLKSESFFKDGKFTVNDVPARIDYLTENVLKEIAVNNDEWTRLYLDESDGRYWELFYGEANWKDIGPPSLRNISEEEAKEKYKI
jgi:hypothetical protein